jgi:hypothetical protein
MKGPLFFGLIITLLFSVCCRTHPGIANIVGRPGPHAIVYKTKGDYSKYVPVTLSDDKSKIVSYPAPQDVFYQGKLAVPTQLHHGYLLDNRGIGPNSGFIKISYEEYSKLSQAPSTDDLYKMLIDKEPFSEMYDLGARTDFKDDKDICMIVKKHKLKSYKRII